jgi:6-phosphofructo-2-kinase
LEENIRKVKLSTPDYRDMDPEQAVADFRQRRELYMSVYEPVDMSDGPHIKIVNSRQFIGTQKPSGVEMIGSLRRSFHSFFNVLSFVCTQ